MDLGNAIKNLRKELGLKQSEIAKRSNLSVTALWNIENGLSFPTKETIDRLATSLGVPVSYLLFYSITENDIPPTKRDSFRYLQEPLKALLMLP